MKLDPRATAAGVRLVAHGVLGSTNAEALDLARRGERGPLWVTAVRQTAGRGRRGRPWISEPGNLHASLLLTGPTAPAHWPQLSLVAALAVHDAILEVAAALGRSLAIKWPNDVLVDRAKVAGILIEGHAEEAGTGRAVAVAIGIGVNCTNHPQDTAYPATDLGAFRVAADDLFAALSSALPERLAQWSGGRGFADVRTDWLARAAGLGERVLVRLDDRELVGRFETIDAEGALVLRLHDDTHMTVAAGDLLVHATSIAATIG